MALGGGIYSEDNLMVRNHAKIFENEAVAGSGRPVPGRLSRGRLRERSRSNRRRGVDPPVRCPP